MTLSMQWERCPRCNGRGGEDSHPCRRCLREGRIDADPLPAPAAVHRYAVERAEAAMLRTLDPLVSHLLAAALSHVTDAAMVLPTVERLTGLAGAAAQRTVAVYAAALREHARIVWRGARHPETDAEREAQRIADACVVHAARVEGCLPRWMRAA